MNILFITKLFPYPPDAGGKLKTYKILQLLSQKHQIHLISFIDNKTSHINQKSIKHPYKSLMTFHSAIINQNHPFILGLKLFASFFSKKPFTVYKYYSLQMKKYIEKFIYKNKLDLIYIDHLAMAQYVPDNFQGKIVCDEHNISYLAFQTYTNKTHNLFLKLIYLIESKKLFQYEKYWIKQFDHIFAISKLDFQHVINLGVDGRKISFLPTPFIPHYCYRYKINKPIILFVGLLSWLPNIHGIDWFVKYVFPLVQKHIPNIQCLIVGKDGQKLTSDFQSLNIRYLGYLENLTTTYQKTTVFIAPIHMGGGIRIKILDVLTHGIPVVTTTLGIQGINLTDKVNCLIADNPKQFAQAIINIIENKHLAESLSKGGFNFIKSNYNVQFARRSLSILDNL